MTARFTFGRNWKRYVARALDADALREAEDSLRAFLAPHSLKGRSFLDVGCGSGLFSLAAFRLGASRIVSFDVDPDSVACCRLLYERAGRPAHWQILHGSVLDQDFVAQLAPADVMYAWGVLHHTGRMWDAIRAVGSRVAPGGLLYLALYNRTDAWGVHPDGRFGPSSFWLGVKRFHHRLPPGMQRVLDGLARAGLIGLYVLFGQNPIRKIRERKRLRGMDWGVDVRDWIGGYPYEYASPGEVVEFCRRELGLALERLKKDSGLGNNEFLFRRPSSA